MSSAPRSTAWPVKTEGSDTPAMNDVHASYMRLAIDAAQRVYTTTPNPRVGCVIVRDGEIVGMGCHEKFGESHAEVNALRQAGERARGAVVYVSLEPCCHFGQTPPCTNALIAAGVAEVVFGMHDPNPLVAGKGINLLREAGIEVHGPVLEFEARQVNRGFIKRMREGLPFVRCKMAMSLDGRTAMASGESQWITGPEARSDVQRLRAQSCAVLTGVNTVLADNPFLNVRVEQLVEDNPVRIAGHQPLRVIVDSGLRIPAESRILTLPGNALVLAGAPNSQQYQHLAGHIDGGRVHVRQMPTTATGQVDLHEALRTLARDYQCNEVLLEAGPTLGGAMIKAGLVDELVVYVGAKLLGSDALPLLTLPGLREMKDHIGLELVDVHLVGGDCRITARLINQ